MDEQRPKREGASRVLWLFVILAIAVLWWYFRPATERHELANAAADRASAETMPDEIIVDLVDDITPAQIASLERDVGIKLVLDSDQAKAEKLYVRRSIRRAATRSSPSSRSGPRSRSPSPTR
jgi:hypothetical protein